MSKLDSPSKIFKKCDIIGFISQADQVQIQTMIYLKRINKIACFHFDGIITLYEAETFKPVKIFKAHKGSITASYFHSQEKKLITQYTGEIKIWDINREAFKELACINVDFSIIYSLELIKKPGHLFVAGEWKGWGRPKYFDTVMLVDLKTEDVLCTWQDTSVVKTLQKIRYKNHNNKKKYLLACGLDNGLIKILTYSKNIRCVAIIKAHTEAITRLHITRINDHPFCITESNDNRIILWNMTSKVCKLRSFKFNNKKMICGSFYKHKVAVIFEEYGREVLFVDLMTGQTVRSIDIGIRRIMKGITLGDKNKVLLILDIPKVMYLGIPDGNVIKNF